MRGDETLAYPGEHEQIADPAERDDYRSRFEAMRAGGPLGALGTRKAFSVTASRALSRNGCPDHQFGVEVILAAMEAEDS